MTLYVIYVYENNTSSSSIMCDVCLMLELVWSCKTIQDKDSKTKTKTVTPKTETKTKTLALKTKTKAVKILSQDYLETGYE